MFKRFLPLFGIVVVLLNCDNKNERNIYPETINGGFELLSEEKTGISFNNSINESIYFNHYFYSQIYVGSGDNVETKDLLIEIK